MAKTRQQKEAEVREVVEGLKEAKSVVVADLSPLKVQENTILRQKAKLQSVRVKGVKKTLFRLAAKEVGLTVDDSSVGGSMTLLLGLDDEVAPARLIAEIRKERKSLDVQGGILESRWMTSEEVIALAKLPSKDQLIAQVVGSIRAPLSGLVGALQGNLRNLVYVLNAVKDSKS
ncbi:50S ribosomal protein L10 [Candidatus Uhrbacteria bacterium RIFOXYC2_FULL_47_19]|uniref:Large ribosomal subunit protein uL10 n=1 Tax=Candidatus Uhrbacteria bacterium RIFOXYC2_FULL_47_19 TaxID=1802424 RepID=A0A1F7WEZ7_9BACT|nr:MAG: 50S ribosomal protein L10 [Candidatus Uhrbacteria bacterium RIFOXYC2_FULL_47_19]HCC21901.1 50S ribosomal protein L10 [Candidatus Uhrbacteria bacterium]